MRKNGEIPYNKLSDSFKEIIDSIEENLNKKLNYRFMKTYLPSNSTDGEAFMDKFCYDCTKEKRCNILIKSLTGESVKEWICNPNPMCVKFKKIGTKYKKRKISDNQKTLF